MKSSQRNELSITHQKRRQGVQPRGGRGCEDQTETHHLEGLPGQLGQPGGLVSQGECQHCHQISRGPAAGCG